MNERDGKGEKDDLEIEEMREGWEEEEERKGLGGGRERK